MTRRWDENYDIEKMVLRIAVCNKLDMWDVPFRVLIGDRVTTRYMHCTTSE